MTEGTWENKVFTEDLVKLLANLKLLQDEMHSVIWRPFHEAAGGWFWWGKNATSFKNMWIAMFNYFKAEGLNNLIWVWTTETGDDDWYPVMLMWILWDVIFIRRCRHLCFRL